MSKDKINVAMKLFVVFDFYHAKLVFTSPIFVIKPNTIEEDYFKLRIPCKLELEDVLDDSIKIYFAPLCIDCFWLKREFCRNAAVWQIADCAAATRSIACAFVRFIPTRLFHRNNRQQQI